MIDVKDMKKVIVQLNDGHVSLVEQLGDVEIEVRDYDIAKDFDKDVEEGEREFPDGTKRFIGRDEDGEIYEAYTLPSKKPSDDSFRDLLIEIANDYEDEGCDGCGTISVGVINKVRENLHWDLLPDDSAT